MEIRKIKNSRKNNFGNSEMTAKISHFISKLNVNPKRVLVSQLAELANHFGIYELTPTQYRQLQTMQKTVLKNGTNLLTVYNAQIENNKTEMVKRSALQEMADEIRFNSQLNFRSLKFLANPFTEKAEKVLNAILKIDDEKEKEDYKTKMTVWQIYGKGKRK